MLTALVLAPMLVTGITNVSIEGFSFVPDSVRVQPGDTVRWTQNDGDPHTSTGTGTGAGQWTSGSLNMGETYQRVFPAAGTYDYICDFHAMFGKVVVAGPTSFRPVLVPEAKAAGASERARDARGRLINSDAAPNDMSAPTFIPRR